MNRRDIIKQMNDLEVSLEEYMYFAVERHGPTEEIWIDEKNNKLVVSLDDGVIDEFWTLDLSEKLRLFEEF